MYIHKLRMQHLRVFADASIEFEAPGRTPGLRMENVTLLLGDNGSGKSSVLKGVCLAALAPLLGNSSGFVPYFLVRRIDGDSGRLAELHADLLLDALDEPALGRQTVQARLLPGSHGTDRFMTPNYPWEEALWREDTPGFFVVGYGAGRRTDHSSTDLRSRIKERVVRYQRVAGLFEEHYALAPLSQWMSAVVERDPQRTQEVCDLVNQLLPNGYRMVVNEAEGVLFKRDRISIPLAAMSDGYRGFLGWVTDLLYHLVQAAPAGMSLTAVPGMVLVDEIDLHLHPAWQRNVIMSLSKCFPKLQFIITSHSPLVVGTLQSANIRVLRDEPETGMQITQPREDMHGWSADQILTSEAFGLESTRDPEVFDVMVQVARKASTGSIAAADRLMQMLASGAVNEGVAGQASKPG